MRNMNTGITAINAAVQEAGAFVHPLFTELGKVIIGQTYLTERLVVGSQLEAVEQRCLQSSHGGGLEMVAPATCTGTVAGLQVMVTPSNVHTFFFPLPVSVRDRSGCGCQTFGLKRPRCSAGGCTVTMTSVAVPSFSVVSVSVERPHGPG